MLGGSEKRDSLIKRTANMTQDAIYAKRDPEEEFFMLSVLALKMIHTEEFDQCDYIYKVNQNGFWKEVKDLELPFHRWYRWLEDKFTYLRLTTDEEKREPEDLSFGFSFGDQQRPRTTSLRIDTKVESLA